MQTMPPDNSPLNTCYCL